MIKTILKLILSAALILVALGAVSLAVFVRAGHFVVMILIVPLCVWCSGMIWLLYFRQRVAPAARKWIAILLLFVLPVCFYFAWTNIWRLEQYESHRHWLSYESNHFVFHYAPDYPRSNEIADFAGIRDQVFEQNCAYLNVSFGDKIDFYIYEKLDEGFAIPDWNVIEADDDQSIGHEMTHIIAWHIAEKRQKIKLLDEGIATWLNHTRRTQNHHEVAWEIIQNNDFPSLSEPGDSKKFRHQNFSPYYPAASFLGYLIENYGVDAFRKLWIANANYPELYSVIGELRLTRFFPFIHSERAHFESTILEIYSRPLNELGIEWRAWLEVRNKK